MMADRTSSTTSSRRKMVGNFVTNFTKKLFILFKLDFCIIPGRRSFVRVDETRNFEYALSNLVTGNSYVIRVAAENSAGVGEFAELTVVPRSPHGELKLS